MMGEKFQVAKLLRFIGWVGKIIKINTFRIIIQINNFNKIL